MFNIAADPAVGDTCGRRPLLRPMLPSVVRTSCEVLSIYGQVESGRRTHGGGGSCICLGADGVHQFVVRNDLQASHARISDGDSRFT